MQCRLLCSFAAIALVSASTVASAQPGASGGDLDGSEYHATPPLPRVMPAPTPSLPPPVALAPGEVPNTPFPASDRPFTVVTPGFVASIERDGRIRFSDDRSGAGILVDPIYGPLVHGRFDLTDALMDWLGASDPYLHQKLAVLDQTRPARARRKANHESRLMERALADLPRYLDAVWSYSAWTHAQRRQVLFELWDEAAESGNEFIRKGGVEARVTISHFIATKIPPTSHYAFSAAEILRMNKDRSGDDVFDPYTPYTSEATEAGGAQIAELGGSAETRGGIEYGMLRMARSL